MWNLKKEGSIFVVSLTGRITASASHELQTRFEKTLQEGHLIAVNMSEVEYISSSGLRVFLSALKQARQKGGDVRLFLLRASVKRVFKIAGMDTLFEIYENEEETTRSFLSMV